ncbi:FKBP-type peptidyl-prolyl cis-trans isomerase [Neolewinella agarilytica]|nr:FKBP-type peptidyl-prolyl cis-trans isomerase [Neolewinella agarilytica]
MKKIPSTMLHPRLTTFLLATILVFALPCCSGSSPAPASAPEKDEATRGAIEERLITELSPSDDRAGRQRNAIINRAIDQNYDVYAAPEGYFYEILEPGDYSPLAEGDIVHAHYQGTFLDGKVFDDSRKRGKKLRFIIGQLIPAWNLALQRLKPGGAIRILTPSELAYGADGLTGPRGDTLVPAHSVLEFLIDEVEIVEE